MNRSFQCLTGNSRADHIDQPKEFTQTRDQRSSGTNGAQSSRAAIAHSRARDVNCHMLSGIGSTEDVGIEEVNARG